MDQTRKSLQNISFESELRVAEKADLIEQYSNTFGRSPYLRTSNDFLISNLCWGLQARKSDHHPRELLSHLIQKLTRSIGRLDHKPAQVVTSGSRLIREWRGTTYEILALDEGYEWNGRTFRSLTEIATLITGSKRSGPKFFGVSSRDKNVG